MPRDGAAGMTAGTLGRSIEERTSFQSSDGKPPEFRAVYHPLAEQAFWLSSDFLEASGIYRDKNYKAPPFIHLNPNGVASVFYDRYGIPKLMDSENVPPTLLFVRGGWPFRCAQGWRVGRLSEDKKENLQKNKWLVSLYDQKPNRSAWVRGVEKWMPNPYVPLCPLWLGLIADVLIWAAIAKGVASAVGLPKELRARYWQRNGRCPNCGFSRQGLAVDARCPECGTIA